MNIDDELNRALWAIAVKEELREEFYNLLVQFNEARLPSVEQGQETKQTLAGWTARGAYNWP